VVVEFVDRPDQAEVSLLDQVEERHAAAVVLLGHRDHQPEVGLGQALLGLTRSGLDLLGEVDFVSRAEQTDLADLFEVQPDRVVRRTRVHLDVEKHLVVDRLDLLEVLDSIGDLDPNFVEGREDTADLVGLCLRLGEGLEDIVER
jgi:hypothetical protein